MRAERLQPNPDHEIRSASAVQEGVSDRDRRRETLIQRSNDKRTAPERRSHLYECGDARLSRRISPSFSLFQSAQHRTQRTKLQHQTTLRQPEKSATQGLRGHWAVLIDKTSLRSSWSRTGDGPSIIGCREEQSVGNQSGQHGPVPRGQSRARGQASKTLFGLVGERVIAVAREIEKYEMTAGFAEGCAPAENETHSCSPQG